MCQNGTLVALLQDAATPPFPLRSPTVVPPCPLPKETVTLSVPFWQTLGWPIYWRAAGRIDGAHFGTTSGCPIYWRADGRLVGVAGLQRKPFRLTVTWVQSSCAAPGWPH